MYFIAPFFATFTFYDSMKSYENVLNFKKNIYGASFLFYFYNKVISFLPAVYLWNNC